jgi:hypothetical protein
MPTDASVEISTYAVGRERQGRLPIGIGLSLGALASVALWAGIGLGLHALLA